ncbi:protein kinase domain-containing protein [Brevibacterium marinum]|uniref:protein kinase domain-containing protein n=1 Tax=Brevibacterium marinum TaxID=418643 RepID=UPI0031D501EB
MTQRLERARRIAAVIAGFDAAETRALVEAAQTVGVGIGGTTGVAKIDGTSVFVKLLPLTRREMEDPFSAVDHSGLPFVSHYGIGSPSHGVGRELAAHQMTSEWVRTGTADFFPLLLGWRILDHRCEIDLSEFDGDGPQRQWGPYWPQVRARLDEMKSASASMVLVLEYVPETLESQLRREVAAEAGGTTFADAVDQIIEATAWIEDQGFHHFDVHPGNILVEEGRLLFTDFGLSLHRGFDLTEDEEASLPAHSGFDRNTGLMHLFHWTLFELGYTSGSERLSLLRAAAADPNASELEPVRAALGEGTDLISHHANIAVDMTDMFYVLMKDVSGAGYGCGRRHGETEATVPTSLPLRR